MTSAVSPTRPLRTPWMRRFMRKVWAGEAGLPGGGQVDLVADVMRLADNYAGAGSGWAQARAREELLAFLKVVR